MAEFHAALGIFVLAAAVVFTLVVAVAARFSSTDLSARPPQATIPSWMEWIERGRVALTAALVIQLSLGMVLYAQDHRPAETIHLIYALAAVGALPLGSGFASEAPARARLWVLAVSGGMTAGIVWRLWGTG